ncbi:Major facilitator superfamily domain, general substrate transporter [Penicillium digitatum]|uniref:Major facilitator superfamily domain, general substrate transporter n=1 Tax=Penicillium digitatum TaxID=36651 RepID=A0A7T6XV83_PENDI|nr:Major facilitator superfamily domain, general substrate transporter [Penicillium digitatum]
MPSYHIGMKEVLNLHGNELNSITVVFWASHCTSLIPACYWPTRMRVNIVLPTLEIGRELFTFGCAWAHNLNLNCAMHFLIRICESCFNTGVIYIIRSWYKPDASPRRAAIIFVASPLGTIFAAYLQAIALIALDLANIRPRGLAAPSELKSRGPSSKGSSDDGIDTYFVSTVNTLPKIATALPVIAALVVGVTADRLGHGSMDTDLSASGNFWPQLSSGFHLKSSYNCRMILER